MEPIVAVAAILVLGVLWAVATRRHQRRREARDADWQGAEARSDVWTSRARCPTCSSAGGVLSREEDRLWFTCLACGARHRRREPG